MTNTGGALEDALWAGVMTRRSLVRGGAGGVTVGEGAWQGRWHGASEGGSQFDVTFFVCKRSCAFFAVRKPCHPYRWGGGGGRALEPQTYICVRFFAPPPPHPHGHGVCWFYKVFYCFCWFFKCRIEPGPPPSPLWVGWRGVPPAFPCGWGGWVGGRETRKFGIKILARRARILIPNFRRHILRLIAA